MKRFNACLLCAQYFIAVYWLLLLPFFLGLNESSLTTCDLSIVEYSKYLLFLQVFLIFPSYVVLPMFIYKQSYILLINGQQTVNHRFADLMSADSSVKEDLGIPKAEFIEDVGGYMEKNGGDAEKVLRLLDTQLCRYNAMNSSLSAKRT